MVYKPGIPQPLDMQDDSQVDMKNNFTQLDDTFDVDHVKFSDTTADNGRHKTVTFVQQSSAPTTAADQVKGYSLEPLAAIGTLEFSRGESDAVSTPVTGKHLSGTINIPASTSVDVVDFAGATRVMGIASASTVTGLTTGPDTCFYFVFDGTVVRTAQMGNIGGSGFSGSLSFIGSGTKLQIRNTSGGSAASNVTWSLNFLRVE